MCRTSRLSEKLERQDRGGGRSCHQRPGQMPVGGVTCGTLKLAARFRASDFAFKAQPDRQATLRPRHNLAGAGFDEPVETELKSDPLYARTSVRALTALSIRHSANNFSGSVAGLVEK